MSRAYRTIRALVRSLLGLFFRRVEVSGLENIPPEGGGLLVAWHPNGLIDPGLIFASFPRQVVFGARHGLFSWPGLGSMMRAIGTVPIYRACDLPPDDPDARRKANARSLEALTGAISSGSFSALFPEGVSHDAPHLMNLKTGAARIYLQARAATPPGGAPPVIIPVGLHYYDKDTFRSNALVAFHPPLEVPDTPGLDDRARAREITDHIEVALEEAIHPTESWDLHRLMHRARKLVRAERARDARANPGPVGIRERVMGFSRVWHGYAVRKESDPEQVAALVQRIGEYDADLTALGLEDHELDRAPRLTSLWLPAILGLQVVLVFLLLPPILLVGYLVNLPAAGVLTLLAGSARAMGKDRKDEATIKLLVGALAFPLSWALAGLLAARAHAELHANYANIPEEPLLAAMVVVGLSILGGAIAVRYVRLARETARAVRVRLTRKRRRASMLRLRQERGELHSAITALAEGIALPGEVGDDGRIRGG